MSSRSFALEYRKRLLAQKQTAREAERARRSEGFIADPAPDHKATAANRARVFGALLIAAGVLAIFNSEALVHWTRGLSSTAAGRQAFSLAMEWDAWMKASSADRLVAAIRDRVTMVRSAAWEDVAGPFAFGKLRAGEGLVRSAASGGKPPPGITGALPALPPPASQDAGGEPLPPAMALDRGADQLRGRR